MLSVDHARWCVFKRSIFASRSSAAIVSSPTLACSPPISAIPRVSRPALQRCLAPGQELVAPAAQLGGGDAELARDQLQLLAPQQAEHRLPLAPGRQDRKSTRLNSSHPSISYAVFCLKKKKRTQY